MFGCHLFHPFGAKMHRGFQSFLGTMGVLQWPNHHKGRPVAAARRPFPPKLATGDVEVWRPGALNWLILAGFGLDALRPRASFGLKHLELTAAHMHSYLKHRLCYIEKLSFVHTCVPNLATPLWASAMLLPCKPVFSRGGSSVDAKRERGGLEPRHFHAAPRMPTLREFAPVEGGGRKLGGGAWKEQKNTGPCVHVEANLCFKLVDPNPQPHIHHTPCDFSAICALYATAQLYLLI